MTARAVLFLGTLALGFCGASTARGDPTPGQIASPPQKTPQEVKESQPAPFGGMLLDHLTAARLTAKAEHCDARVELAKQEGQEKLGLTIAFHVAMRTSDQQAADKKLQLVEDTLTPQWYDHPLLWFAGGVAVTVVAIGLAVLVVDGAREIR